MKIFASSSFVVSTRSPIVISLPSLCRQKRSSKAARLGASNNKDNTGADSNREEGALAFVVAREPLEIEFASIA